MQQDALRAAGARQASRRGGGERRADGVIGTHHASGRGPFPHRPDRPRARCSRAGKAGARGRGTAGRESAGHESFGHDAVDSGAASAGQAERLLYCPSQLVLRAGLAANALIEGIHGPLAELLIPEEQRDKHQERIDEVRAHDGVSRVHTRASTWGIPFSWFCLFQEADHTDVVESEGHIATVRIRASIGNALERVSYAVAHLAIAAPDLDMLEDLTQLTEWLELFHPGSVVELDYGAVADKVYPDDSPLDVRLGIECLAEGDMTGAAAAYRRLASRWVPIRQLARAS